MLNNLKKQIQILTRKIDTHIGNNGFENHVSASDNYAGFMPPDLYKASRQLFRRRTWLPNDTDIMTLTPGYYTGVRFLNGPIYNESWICDVDVIFGYDGRKNIFFYDNTARKLYFTTVTSNENGNTYEWSILEQTVELWRNSNPIVDTPTGFTIVSTKPLSYFRSFEFVYQTSYNPLWQSNKFYASNGSVSLFYHNLNNAVNGEYELQLEISELQLSIDSVNHKFNVELNKTIRYKPVFINNVQTVTPIASYNEIRLMRIYGIR